jgi:hypothetical protein
VRKVKVHAVYSLLRGMNDDKGVSSIVQSSRNVVRVVKSGIVSIWDTYVMYIVYVKK